MDHEVVVQDMQLRMADAAPPLIAPRVVLAILPLVEIFYSTQQFRIPADHAVDFGESPPPGASLTGTIILQI